MPDRRRVVRRLLIVFLAIAITAPVWLGAWEAIARLVEAGGDPGREIAIPLGRWAASATTALAAGLLSLLLAWPMVRVLGDPPGREASNWTRAARGLLAGLSVVSLIVPAFVIGRGLMAFTTQLGYPTVFVPIFAAGQTSDPVAGAIGVAVVGALAGWPLSAWLLLVARRARRPGEIEALLAVPAASALAGRRMTRRVEFARYAPFAAMAVALVSLRTFLDSATPSLLGQRSYAREIMVEMNLMDGGIGPVSLLTALGAAALTVPLVLVAIATANRAGLVSAVASGSRPIAATRRRRVAAWIGWGALLFVGVALPLIALARAPHAPIPWARILAERQDALAGSLWLAGWSAAIAAVLGVVLAALANAERSARWRALLWLAPALTFAWPAYASAFGLLAIDLPATTPDGLRRVFDLGRLVAGSACRYSLVAMLAASIAMRRVARSEVDAALASGLSAFTRWRVVHMRRQLHAAVAAGACVGLLALVERETAEVVFVPGFDTVTACVFRLLHTGTDSVVLGLLVITLGSVTLVLGLAGLLVPLLLRRRDV